MNSCEAVALYWVFMGLFTKEIWMVMVGGLVLGTGWMLGEWAEEECEDDTGKSD